MGHSSGGGAAGGLVHAHMLAMQRCITDAPPRCCCLLRSPACRHALLCTSALQLGPLRNVEGTAEIAGCLSAAGLVLILALCLSVYGSASFQSSPKLGVKTLSGRSVQRDPLQSAEG